MKRWMLAAVLFWGICFLSGCTNRELEDRYFPLAMEVHSESDQYQAEYALPNMGEVTGQNKSSSKESEKEEKDTREEKARGKTMEEACENFQSYVEKYIDSGHIKVLIIGTEILNDPQKLKEVLSFYEGNVVYGRSMLVYAYEKTEEDSLITKTAGSLDSIGSYLEDLINNNPYRNKDEIITLGDLLEFWHNQDDSILIPQLTVQNEKPVSLSSFELENAIQSMKHK